MKYASIIAVCFFALCESTSAAWWFQWTDSTGRVHVTPDRPMGVPYTEVSLPDPIRWYNPPKMPVEIADDGKNSAQTLFKLASQSVYWILKRSTASIGTPNAERTVYGSAVAVSEDLAITNCHVIAGAGDDAVIGSANPEELAPVEMVAVNVEEDRCVVRSRRLRLRPVSGVRRFDTIEIGETVYAIGNPRRLELTLSDGLLSGKRQVGTTRLLQTTAPISPGSSGGGLFDSRGNLVGITAASLRGSQNINFAIPAEDFWK